MFDLSLPERKLVDDFEQKLNFRCYFFKDQDTGHIRPLSDFDFVLFANNKAVIIEAKKNNNWLSENQKLAAMKAEKSNSKYYVLIFASKYKDGVKLTDRHRFYDIQGLNEVLSVLKSDLYDT